MSIAPVSCRLLSGGHLSVPSGSAGLLHGILVMSAQGAEPLAVSSKPCIWLHGKRGRGNLLGNAADLVEILANLIAYLLNTLQLLRCCALMLLEPGKVSSVILFSLLELVCHLHNGVDFLAHSLDLLL